MKPFPYIGASDSIKPHLEKIFAGEYNIQGLKFEDSPTILDIGANIGAYSYWAAHRFPNSRILAFEPDPTNVKHYIDNTRGIPVQPWNLTIMQNAVYPDKDKITLYRSKVNEGMHSIHKDLTNTENAESIEVKCIDPSRLPDCHILKMDTEGCEVEILKSYLNSHKNIPAVISFEFHSAQDYYELDRMLSIDYIPASGVILHPSIGTMNYIYKDSLKWAYSQR